jgi:hypothetical protein
MQETDEDLRLMQENGNLLQRRIFDPGVWRLKRFCFQGGCKLQADDAAQHPTSCQATTWGVLSLRMQIQTDDTSKYKLQESLGFHLVVWSMKCCKLLLRLSYCCDHYTVSQ